MKELIKEWKTSELIEFLNSYNRVFEIHPSEALPFQKLYVFAFAELYERNPLIAMLY